MKEQRLMLRQKAIELYKQGSGVWDIVYALDVNISTLRRWLKESGVHVPEMNPKREYLRNWRTRMREIEYYED